MGTRKSALALAQTGQIIDELKRANPGSGYDVMEMQTRGDTDSKPLFAINQRGIFEKEIDLAVADGRMDFAVHSLKDVPTDLPEKLCIACVPRREAANDVIISGDGAGLDSVVPKGIVGTSSLRRAVQIMRKRPDLQTRPIRGNIETRIKKISDGYDAIVLAQAGISRLGLNVRYSRLPVDDFTPSPGQGALAVVARADDAETIGMLEGIEDAQARAETMAERALSSYVESGCRFPVGAHARTSAGKITLRVEAFSVDAKKSLAVERTGPAEYPAALGEAAGRQLQKMGIDELSLNWREKMEEWNR